MPKIDPDGMDPSLVARLRRDLDGIRPRLVAPRYLNSSARVGVWRFAPAALAVAFTGILALTAFAATGSPNPVVWTQRVQTVINPPAPVPTNEATPTPPQKHTESAAPSAPEHESSPESSESPEPAGSPEPSESPQPTESPEPTASPQPRESPEPGDHQTSTSDSGDGQRS